MASSGNFDPNQTYDRQWEVARWTNVGGHIPTGGRPIYSSSKVISRINNQDVVKRIRRITYSTNNPDAEGSEKFDGEEVEMANPFVGNPSSTSRTQPPVKDFHSQIITSTPRSFQYIFSTVPSSVPPSFPNLSTTMPSPVSPIRQSLIPQPRPSEVLNSQKFQTVARASRRGKYWLPLPFPASEEFQRRDLWPIRVTREYPNVVKKGKDAVARCHRGSWGKQDWPCTKESRTHLEGSKR
ncbi:hypothetical protein O181_091167 [Austropuccinia psidii MF-1]|uniref:Uncharacterized protein n=1 Tax=Austropuccinia psidii MF-1 TaxID=1389203 RepID=A0A9Q3P8D1_9BASI|nr:hypothetical protein [Austropuccinia psidii MF-1]